MSTNPGIFQHRSLFNLGSLLGLALGLSIGILGAVAWNMETRQELSELPPGVNPTPTADQRALNELRIAWASEHALLADTLRAIASGTDRRGAEAALRRSQDLVQSAFRELYGQNQANSIVQPFRLSTEAMIDYADALHLDSTDARNSLSDSREHMQNAAAALARAEGQTSTANVMAMVAQMHTYMRSVAELADNGNSVESYSRQQQAIQVSNQLVDVLSR